MIESVAKVGRFALNQLNKSPIEQLVEDPSYPYVFFILLKESDGQFTYTGIDYEETAPDYVRYLFRGGSSRGANFSPTAKVTELPRTFDQKILGWLKSLLGDKNAPYTDLLKSMYDLLVKNKNQILADLAKKMESVKGNCLVSIKVNEIYPLDYEPFAKAFLYLNHKKDFEVMANERICSVCNEKKDTVIGKMSAFKFYTLDKPGFITGGFNEADSWRNYPVCLECKSYIEEGRKYIENKLKYSFYGLPYLLIPKFLLDEEEMGEGYEEILDILDNQDKFIKLSKEQGRSIMTDEGDLMMILSEMENTVALELLFLAKVQSAERILLTIDDVLPSRLRNLFVAKEEIEKSILLNPNTNETGHFHFGFFRTFFSKSDEGKRNADLNQYFLNIVDSVFKRKPLHLTFLLKFMMKEIRKSFLNQNEQDFYWKVKRAISSIVFLEKIGVLEMKGGEDSMSKFDPLFQEFGNQLNTNEKKAIFLLGALTQILLEIQQMERGAKPFMKQLMGLKMDERGVKSLLPKVVNKLEEYDKYTKSRRQLAEEVSLFFMKSNRNWRMSVDELNFYFVSGMNLASKVKDILYAKEEGTVNA